MQARGGASVRRKLVSHSTHAAVIATYNARTSMRSLIDLPVASYLVRRIALLACGLGLAVSAVAMQPIPAFSEVKAGAVPSVGVLLARDGTPLAERRLNPHVRRLEWVGLHSLSPSLKEALLAAEDKRFFEHSGVDWKAFAGSLWHNLWYDRKRGASTLSMQVAGLLDPELALGRDGMPRRSLGQKWDQALAAQALEARWTKEQILEAYLNLAPFRGDLQGVHAAARALFGKSPTELGRPEALILSVLLRGPNAKPDVVAHRACVLAERLNAPSACTAAQRLAANNLDRQHTGPRWELASQAGRLLLQHPGERLTTTLDADIQRGVTSVLHRLGTLEAAAVVLDNPTGEVLAYVGAPDYAAPDHALTPRNPGSLLSPFAYGLALERRLITAASLMEESLANHAPTLPDERMWVSVRRALVEGMSDPAQAVGRLVADGLPDRLRQADVDVRGGSTELALLPLAALYRSLAVGGQWQAPRFLAASERPSRRVLRPEASFIVADMLAVPDADGNPQPFAFRQYAADSRETLTVGFSERFTIVLWVAGLRNAPQVSGQAWHDILRGLLRGQTPSRPLPPPGVVSSLVVFEPPVESPRREWFIRGTEVERVAVPRLLPRIAQPLNGVLVDAMALMRDEGFKVYFEATHMPEGARWRLNGEDLGSGERIAWRPVAGRHVLELMSADGQVLDSVIFAVRAPLEPLQRPDQQPDSQ